MRSTIGYNQHAIGLDDDGNILLTGYQNTGGYQLVRAPWSDLDSPNGELHGSPRLLDEPFRSQEGFSLLQVGPVSGDAEVVRVRDMDLLAGQSSLTAAL